MSLAVAVLGLGEAGGAIASGLAAKGCEVRGWDPDETRAAEGVRRASTPSEAVAGTELVLSLATAAHALDAVTGVVGTLGPSQLYADLNTTAPALKREVAAAVAPTGAAFADVALVGVVPAQGIETPALASGGGAGRFAELVRPFGMPVDVVGGEPGEAAGHRLLRSVFMKGLAAAVLESLEAARRRGAEDRLRGEIADVVGEQLLDRLVSGSLAHAERRRDEMAAAAAYLEELGVEPRVARAAAGWLGQLAGEQRTPPA